MCCHLIPGSLLASSLCIVALLTVPGCQRSTTLKARLNRAEQSSVQAERHLDEAEGALRALDPARAEGSLRSAKEALAEPDVAYYPERESIRERYKNFEGQLASTWAEVRRRELDSKVAEQQLSLEQPLARWKESLKGLGSKQLDEEILDRVRDATEQVRDQLKEGQPLEAQHAGYSKQADGVRQTLQKEAPRLEVAEKTLAFIKGPGKTRQEGLALWKQARSQKDRKRQHEMLDEVRGKFWSCSADAREMLAATPLLAKTSFLLDGATASPSLVAKGCATRVDTLDKSLAALTKEEQRRQAAAAARAKKVRRH